MANRGEIKLGIVGCGGISHAHGHAAARTAQQIRFAACCDIREEAADNWAAAYSPDAAVYTDYEKMVREQDLDGVLLATWPNQHREQIEKCLAAGARNILCEKALTLTGAEAVEIMEIVGSAGAFLMEGFMYRHHPAIRKLERILSSGELGPVDNVRAAFSAYDPEAESADDSNRNWRQRKECGGGIPYDFACYCVNACNHFVADIPLRVFASGGVSKKYDTVNRMYGMIEYAGGQVGIIESSKKASFNQELQITCAKAILHLPVTWTPDDAAIRQIRSEVWGQLLTDTCTVGQADAYQLQLENFAAAIRDQAEPVMPLPESVANTFTVQALVTSILEKRIVEIELPDLVTRALGKETQK